MFHNQQRSNVLPTQHCIRIAFDILFFKMVLRPVTFQEIQHLDKCLYSALKFSFTDILGLSKFASSLMLCSLCSALDIFILVMYLSFGFVLFMHFLRQYLSCSSGWSLIFCVAEKVLEHLTLPPLPPTCWDYWCVPQCPS